MGTTEKLSIEAFASRYASPLAHLVCRASFEQRSLTIAEAVALIRDIPTTVFYSKRRGAAAQANFDRVTSLSGDNKPSTVELDVEKPLEVGASIAKTLHTLHQATGLEDTIIDVTSFRREELLMLFAVLGELGVSPKSNCVLAYVAAARMGPWMSGQVTGHRSVIGYAGNMRPSLPTKLVVLMGFETLRATSIVENYEPNALLLGHGRPSESINTELSAENERFFRDLKSHYAEVAGTFEFSARDPIKVATELEAAIQGLDAFNVIVAPLHTKLSTLGAGIFARRHRDVQICYAPVAEYNESAYSEPSADVFLMPLSALLID